MGVTAITGGLDLVNMPSGRLAEATYRGVGPRVNVSPEDEVQTVQGALAVTSPLLRKLDADRPVVVPKWRIRGNSTPGARQALQWLSGPGCVRVWPDDRVEPTDDEADAP